MYSHFTFLSVCHLMTCYDDRFGSSHKRSDCRHLLLFHGIQLLTAVSSIMQYVFQIFFRVDLVSTKSSFHPTPNNHTTQLLYSDLSCWFKLFSFYPYLGDDHHSPMCSRPSEPAAIRRTVLFTF